MTELGVEKAATGGGFVGPGDGMVRTHGLAIASFEIVAHGRVGCLELIRKHRDQSAELERRISDKAH